MHTFIPLAVKHPELAKEWHPTKNDGLTPNDVPSYRKVNVWWICSRCNHEYQRMVEYRVNSPDVCPKCRPSYGRSTGKKPDRYLFEVYPHLLKEWDYSRNKDVDVDKVGFGSGKQYWWKCTNHKCRHRWKTSPNGRTKKEDGLTGCPKLCTLVREKKPKKAKIHSGIRGELIQALQSDSKLLRTVLKQYSTKLQPIEKDIALHRLGLEGTPMLTLREIGEKHSVSREWVRQLERNLFENLCMQFD